MQYRIININALQRGFFGFLIILMATAVFAQPQTPGTPSNPDSVPLHQAPDYASLSTGTVIRVLDQNTVLIEIDGETERLDLLGVSGATGAQHASQAKQAIDTLNRLTLGETVLIQNDPSGELNRANKRVAYLYRAPDHLFINLELVRQGLTRLSNASMSIHSPLFEHYQRRAQQRERGIWNPNEPPPQPDTLADPLPAPSEAQPSSGPDRTIYITAHGTKYHRKDCSHLTDSARPTTRESIATSHGPCKTCEPDAP